MCLAKPTDVLCIFVGIIDREGERAMFLYRYLWDINETLWISARRDCVPKQGQQSYIYIYTSSASPAYTAWVFALQTLH